jgi:hypothetical protein
MVYFLGRPNFDGYGSDCLDGDPMKIHYVEPYLGLAHLTPIGNTGGGAPVSDEFMPTRLRWNGPRREIPDFTFSNGMFCVSEKFKQVIERFEPGKHQFFPVEISWKNGEIAGRHYLFFFTTTLDAIEPNLTTLPRHHSHWMLTELGKGHRLVFDSDIVNGHHIWRERHATPAPYISDALAAAISEAKLTGPALVRREETNDTATP